jgi:hypothetical protein
VEKLLRSLLHQPESPTNLVIGDYFNMLFGEYSDPPHQSREITHPSIILIPRRTRTLLEKSSMELESHPVSRVERDSRFGDAELNLHPRLTRKYQPRFSKNS